MKTATIPPSEKSKKKHLTIFALDEISEFKLPRTIDVADKIKTNCKEHGYWTLTIDGVIVQFARDPAMIAITVMHSPVRLSYWVGQFESIQDYLDWAVDYEAETSVYCTKKVASTFKGISPN